MERQNGVAIIEVTDNETKSFFIDQEQIEFARQNAYTKKRREEKAKADKEAERKRRKAAKEAAQRKAFTFQTVRCVLACIGIVAGTAWGGSAGMIHPVIYIPVICAALCVACTRCGLWFGRMVKQ